jgi:CBS domain-containing protein
MKVKDVMTKEVKTISPDTPLRMVNQLLQKYNLSYLIIVDEKNEIEGIITYTDLFRLLLPSYEEVMTKDCVWLFPERMEERVKDLVDKPVSEVMTRKVLTVSSDELVITTGAKMIAHKIKQMPVVGNNTLVGVLTFHDILWEFLIVNRP